jgi:ribosomal protein S18 acetylase RimI-like enzyme
MTSQALDLRVDTSSAEQIRSLLLNCDDSFIPRLSDRVEIADYSSKIREKALTFEAWKAETLIGLLAAYFNSSERICYITNLSVLPAFARTGIAKRLLTECLARAKACNMECTSLEVGVDNHRAIGLYSKFGFQVVQHRGSSVLMTCIHRQGSS